MIMPEVHRQTKRDTTKMRDHVLPRNEQDTNMVNDKMTKNAESLGKRRQG